ncbi:MAG: hypothetical protein Q7W02_10740 [Candidatus Rokubacteria bacterium]|nr:hypothetical protein [Candidatus Rokubacteria bacterium]
MKPTRSAAFQQLREFLEHDIEHTLAMGHGGNYMAALVLMVGAEALSLLVDGDENDVPIKLLARNEVDKFMALDVMTALRDGIAHTYETKYVKVGAELIEMVVSWGERQHLTLRVDPLGLYVNVRTLWGDLREELGAVEARLKANAEWAGQVPKKSPGWIREATKDSRPGWEKLLQSYGKGVQP